MYKPFRIHPQYIQSQDGDRHYIQAGELVRLWQLPAELCQTYPAFTDGMGLSRSVISRMEGNVLHVYPDPSGEYLLTLEQELFKRKHLSLLLSKI